VSFSGSCATFTFLGAILWQLQYFHFSG
jgi:hypothetical protein